MEATSFGGKEGEGVATDKTEETFLTQPSEREKRENEQEREKQRTTEKDSERQGERERDYYETISG